MLELPHLAIDLLPEVASADDEHHCHERELEVRGRAHGIAREHAEAAAVGGTSLRKAISIVK